MKIKGIQILSGLRATYHFGFSEMTVDTGKISYVINKHDLITYLENRKLQTKEGSK